MLQHIRERFTGVFAVVLLGMLAISFVFFGIGNFTFLSGDYAAKVEDAEISQLQLENAYQNQLLSLTDYGNIPAEFRQTIKANTLERMIREMLIELHVSGRGYRVSDELIAAVIQEAPQFQEDGEFNRELYYTWLDQTVQDPRVFEAQQRQAIRTSQMQRGIGATAFVTPSEYRRYLNLYAEKRQASLAIFDIADLAGTIVVSDEDARAVYDARPDDFRAAESVDFEYVEVNRDSLAESIDIADDVLQQHYSANSSRFLQDEQRRARHILITASDDDADKETLATALAERARAGEPFADLARQYSEDGGTSGQGGDLGAVLHTAMPGALGDAIFSMAPDEIVGPVRTDFGFHIIRLDEVIPGGPLPLDDVRAELLQELRTDGVESEARALERQLSDALFDATDLRSVADDVGLEVQQVTGFTRTGGAPFGDNQNVVDAVFDPLVLDEGQISDLVEVDAVKSVMLRVVEYHEAARKEFEVVRDEIVFSLQSERAINIIEDRSRRLREALEEGQDFEEMAFELEASYSPDLVVERVDADVDAAVLDAIFRAKKPSPGHARLGSTITTNGDYAVFMVNSVIPGRPEDIPLAERDQRKQELENAAGAADLNAFVNELSRTASIERNDAAVTGPDFLQ